MKFVSILLLACSISEAQVVSANIRSGQFFTGTNAAGGGFSTPADYSPLAWYASDYNVTNDVGATPPSSGGDIDAIGDKSGNNNALVKSSANFQYETGIQNGLPAIETFGHAGSLVRSALTQGTISQPFTVYFVGSHLQSAENQVFLAPNSGQSILGFITTAHKSTVYAGTIVSASASTASGWHYWTYTYDGANSEIREDGAQIVTGNIGSGTMAGIRLGNDDSAAIPWNDYIGEFIIYSGAHDATQKSNVENWLKARWGL